MRIKMKKFAYTILLGASALVAACTALPREEQVTLQGNPDEVAFSAYLNRSTTKAGAVGELKTDGLQTAGFGVFGYHTDNALYSQAALPNFMYNTKVSTSNWTYSPIKYWPNEFGENASSEAIDRLTFFAYAPWVEVNSSTGALKVTEDPGNASTSHSTGITRLSRATDTGDPMVSYVASFNPASSVDLTWGVAKEAFNNSAGTSEGTNDIAANTPYINVARPSAGKTIDFTFQHALAALNVTVDANVAGEALKANQTRIYVRSVTFEGFAGEGSLNLNSTVAAGPQWVNYFANGALSTESVTIYDGRRDGREATSADANEKPSNLNPVIIQSTTYAAGAKAGVTATAVNLFNSATSTAPVYVIPTGDKLKVTIAYDVETRDPKILGTYLADGIEHGSVVENTITKTIDLTMEAGKKYVVALHLGLNSVDFDADITAWGDGEDTEANLPANSGVAMTFTEGGTPVSSPLYLWVGDSGVARTATLPSGYSAPGGITYSSSNPAVATVDENGTVSPIGPGEAVITASATATKATYSALGSYTVYVNNATPTITLIATPANYVVNGVPIIDAGEKHKATITANVTWSGPVFGNPEPTFTSSDEYAVTVEMTSSSGNSHVASAIGVDDGTSTISVSLRSVTKTIDVRCMKTKVIGGTGKYGPYTDIKILRKGADGTFSLDPDPMNIVKHYRTDMVTENGTPESGYRYYFTPVEVRDITVGEYHYDDYSMDGESPHWLFWRNDDPETKRTFRNRGIEHVGPGNVMLANIQLESGDVLKRCLILAPDGSTVQCVNLSFELNTDNILCWVDEGYLTYDQYRSLVDGGCIIFPAAGLYDVTDSNWKGLNLYGCYGTHNVYYNDSGHGWAPGDDPWSLYTWQWQVVDTTDYVYSIFGNVFFDCIMDASGFLSNYQADTFAQDFFMPKFLYK